MPLRFSIITCTWNSLPLLEESVASVLIQDYPHIEYIFVDSGSTDGTLDMLSSLRRPYTLLENVRGSLSQVMNAGLRAATGDVVTYLGPDNYYLGPETLITVAAHLEDGKHGWLFGRAPIDVNGELCSESRITPPFSYQRLLQENFIPSSAAFVRRQLMLRTAGFNTQLRHAMHYDLWLKLACLSHPKQLNEPLVALREEEGILPTRKRLAVMEEEMVVRLAHTGHYPFKRFMHYLRYLIRRRRMLQLGSGRFA